MSKISHRSAAYADLCNVLAGVATLDSVGNVLSWDQETKMPPKGARLRADQLKLLAQMVHERRTDPRIGELLAECQADSSLTSDEQTSANLREIRRDYDRAMKLPASLVAEIAECASLGMDAWKQARSDNHFPTFLPWLEKTVELSGRKAECLGLPQGGSEMYDTLVDEWEPGMTAARTAETFAPLREFTVKLIRRVNDAPSKPPGEAMRIETPIEKQRAFVERITEQVGFDFRAGRMDDTTHPFCQGMGPGDTRITNRYRADGWTDALSSGLHEGGHGIYEQNIPKGEHWGRPLGEHVSLGIHESQSRLYENLIGRSGPFWRWAVGIAAEEFGAAMKGVTAERVYKAVNLVEPGFIRVEADEVSYNLHIMMRFDLERAMVKGDLSPRDLPGVWNERFERDFGRPVPEDRLGCLQDVHWSMGSLGYFPTYTFGNIYAAQFWEAMAKDIPDRDEQMARGEFGAITAWLTEKIHRHGRRYRAEELCERITGSGMDSAALMRHLEQKVEAVYGA